MRKRLIRERNLAWFLFTCISLVALMGVSSFLFTKNVYAGSDLCQQIPCNTQGFPDCFTCNPATDNCEPNPTLCDDGNACTSDICGILGCVSEPLALETPFPQDLPIECYVCEPTENGVTVDNGVCDRAAGEDCTNSVDCQVPGETCIFPNVVEPPPPLCAGLGPVTFPLFQCADGDVCTLDECVLTDPSTAPGVCSNPERTCDITPDGCCPSDCVGPTDLVQGCPAGIATNCDPDCWPPQLCGDGFVQPPETCDDSADLSDAGVRPDGSIVTNPDCRDAGSTDECTYCGDNIIQTASGEQCDGTQVGVCDETGCETSTCLCNSTDFQVQGSGPPWGPCSLSSQATDNPIRGMLGLFSLGLAVVLLAGWRRSLS